MSRINSTALLVAVLLFMAVTMPACGSSSDSESDSGGVAKITPSGTIYSLDDLLAVGFKKAKTFDVEGLTAATSAYYGFWGLDPYDRKEFEARFYKSHADAVEFGTAFADERTGPDAIIKSGETSWEEGAKEARSCVRISSNASCHLSKYGDYVIYGNMILICQGRDSATSLEQCAALLDEVAPTPAEG
jgi:hypothetical protein